MRDKKGRFIKGYGDFSPEKRKEIGTKISLAKKGKTFSEEHKKKLSLAKLGISRSEETKRKISESTRGERSCHWQGGITPIGKALRNSLEYEEWRRKVFEKDLYTCQKCGKIGGYLHANHKKGFALYPELQFEVDNGETLCVPCHFFITFEKIMPENSKWGHYKREN